MYAVSEKMRLTSFDVEAVNIGLISTGNLQAQTPALFMNKMAVA
jgi:hypothetical protein